MQQARPSGPHDGAEGVLVAERFGLKGADPSGQVAQHPRATNQPGEDQPTDPD